MKDTRIHLVEELLKYQISPEIAVMIKEAKAGEYHDFKNEKYACGKMEASRKLRAAGLTELACRLENGEFDEEPDDDDKAEMRKTLPKKMWAAFGLGEDA